MTKKAKIFLTIIVILFAIYIIFFKIINIEDRILKKIFPQEYSEYVYKYSKEFNVDPIMIFSIIKAESNFNNTVISTSDAIGLMQLLEDTAKETATKIGYEYTLKENLYNPEINIMLGTKYFADLLELYEGNTILALTAYNAGIGNVAKWIETGVIKSDGSDIQNIPFKETNRYVRRIFRNYRVYKSIY